MNYPAFVNDRISEPGIVLQTRAGLTRVSTAWRKQWFDYKHKAYAREARFFLIANEIPFSDDAGLETAPPG